MSQDVEADKVPSYAVRVSPQAQKDIEEAAFCLADLTQNSEAGEQWGESLYLEIGRLATYPRRFAVAERETRLFGREIRQMVYRRSAASVAYFILFSVAEQENEGPTVTVLHVRHSGKKPLTRAAARQMLADQ